MRKLVRSAGLAAAVLALAGPASALAQGGPAAGGGGAGGGGGPTTPPPTSSACAQITSFGNSTGYYRVWAAIWSTYAISNSCAGTVNWQMTYTNGTTGAVDFTRLGSTYYGAASGTVDEDWAAFSTPYTVTLTVSDSSGAGLDSRTAVVSTRAPKSGTTG